VEGFWLRFGASGPPRDPTPTLKKVVGLPTPKVVGLPTPKASGSDISVDIDPIWIKMRRVDRYASGPSDAIVKTPKIRPHRRRPQPTRGVDSAVGEGPIGKRAIAPDCTRKMSALSLPPVETSPSDAFWDPTLKKVVGIRRRKRRAAIFRRGAEMRGRRGAYPTRRDTLYPLPSPPLRFDLIYRRPPPGKTPSWR
jgi:hypothetical protein